MRCRTASKPGLELCTSPSGSPSGWPSGAALSSHAAATPTSRSGHGWLSLFQWPVPVGRRWIPRMASSRLRRQQATRAGSRGRSVPTVWLFVTRIPSGR